MTTHHATTASTRTTTDQDRPENKKELSKTVLDNPLRDHRTLQHHLRLFLGQNSFFFNYLQPAEKTRIDKASEQKLPVICIFQQSPEVN